MRLRLGWTLAWLIASTCMAAEPNALTRLEPDTFNGGLGINVHFSSGHRQEVDRIAASGFKIVRMDLLWARIETQRGIYDWRGTDELYAAFEQNHLTPLFILAYSNPLYARRLPGRPQTDSMAYAVPDQGASRAAFMAFVKAAVHRYGRHAIWEVWNEPDHNFGVPVDLRSYVAFAQEACQTVRAIAPNAAVIGPAASGFEWWLLKAFIAADRTRCFDAVSVHPYRDEPPESVSRQWAQARRLLPDCDKNARCARLVDSEWGYSVTDGAWTAERQAAFVVRLRLLDMMAGIPMTIIYDWQNDGPDPIDKEANFGLLDFQGKPKPALGALQGMVRSLNGLGFMGRVVTDDKKDFVLAFGANGMVRQLVGWTTQDGNRAVTVVGSVCTRDNQVDPEPREACPANGQETRLEGSLTLSSMPRAVPIQVDAAGIMRVVVARPGQSG